MGGSVGDNDLKRLSPGGAFLCSSFWISFSSKGGGEIGGGRDGLQRAALPLRKTLLLLFFLYKFFFSHSLSFVFSHLVSLSLSLF